MRSRRRQPWSTIAAAGDINGGNPSDLGANPVLDHADTDDCQARVLSRELPEVTIPKLAGTLSSASLNNRLSKKTDFDGIG